MTTLPAMLDRVSFALLCGLAAVLPFELRTPLTTIGPIAVSNVELVLYGALGAAGLAWLSNDRRIAGSVTVLHLAVLVWMAAVAVTALAAPLDRGAAVKFAMRSAGGVLVFLATARGVRTAERAALVVASLAAGAVVSAAAGILETWLPGVRDSLMPFREQPVLVGSFARASGTFDYPNTAAMYWQAALFATVGGAAWLSHGRAAAPLRAAAAAVALLTALALGLTGSRAGLLMGFAGLSVLAVVGWRASLPLRSWVAAGLTGLALSLVASPAPGGLIALRLRSAHVAEWYRPVYRIAPDRATLQAGSTAAFDLTIRNAGLVAWPADGNDAVVLSYYWEDAEAPEVRLSSGARIALPHRVDPGADVNLLAGVHVPVEPGRYRLTWDLLVEHVVWFSLLGSPTGQVEVVVTPAMSPIQPAPRRLDAAVMPERRADRRELWRVAWRMWRDHPLMGVGPDNFRRLYGSYLDGVTVDARVHANSLYLEVLATMGLVGVAALGSLLLAMGVQIWRGWRVLEPASQALLAGAAAGLGAFVVHGLVDYFLIFTPTYGLFWLLAGLVAGLTSGAPTR